MATKRNKKLSSKQIESYLQDLDDFDEPKIQLEQYATPPHIAAQMLSTIDQTFDDIEDKLVADLGCGTGRLSIGSVLCGAEMVLGFDIDLKALESGVSNVRDIFGESDDESQEVKCGAEGAIVCSRGCERINFVQADVTSEDWDNFWSSMNKRFDTVIMNPPFGTKQAQGIDMLFLRRAIDLAEHTVYSLHKTSTREVSCLIILFQI